MYMIWRGGVFASALLCIGFWFYQAWSFALGPDPGKIMIDRLGLGALILLLITLSLSPLYWTTRWKGWLLVRRQLGLWAFAYAALHFCSYLVFVLGLDLARLGIELQKRPYIIVGLAAFLCLLPMAVTSNQVSMRRLGRTWKRIHRLVYVVLGLALLHMFWVIRSDIKEWTIYAGAGLLLLMLRIPFITARLKQYGRSD
ncbi:sulfoxide reductase heme-binding subunit YedZ [Pseudomonas duriflava]|uniref:Protein-methionine-sulfoxide reductase heme-binding subunit MsrQ n=2 Tax=Pseudomonas duriflava TaxID=459528 RepID=A0A562Q422_9PSED|nr:sulfoxide reductase heme-binding subunit YedZ [Pseudomonas duriflava]